MSTALTEVGKMINDGGEKLQESHEIDLQVGVDGQSKEEDRDIAATVEAEEEAEQDYCCKYCDKKFYNKQALGGHQNAHRVERAMEKSAKKGGGGFMDFGYLGHPFSPLSGLPSLSNFPAGPFNWYQDLLNRQLVSKPYFQPHSIPSEIPTRPYAYPFSPLPEISPLFQMAHPRVENHSFHARILMPAMTISGSNAFSGVPRNSPVTPRPGFKLNCNPRNQEIKDGELDLTLKL